MGALGANLRTINWDLDTLPKFEKVYFLLLSVQVLWRYLSDDWRDDDVYTSFALSDIVLILCSGFVRY